jgi:hypothetical protein
MKYISLALTLIILFPHFGFCYDEKEVAIRSQEKMQLTLGSVAKRLSCVKFYSKGIIQTTPLKTKETELLIRACFKKAIPCLSHEVVSYDSAFKTANHKDSSIYLKEKAGVQCTLWTSGNPSNYPIALHLSCKLYSYGDIPISEISSAFLCVTSKDSLNTTVNSAIKSCIEDIADEFYKQVVLSETSYN